MLCPVVSYLCSLNQKKSNQPTKRQSPMKKRIAALLLAASAFAATFAARADVIWHETFNYPNGNLTNVSLNVWTNISGGKNDMFVNNHYLEVAATGGVPVSRTDDDARLFGSPYTNSVQVIYASFTLICTNLPSGGGNYFASFYSTANGYFGRVQAFTNGTSLPNTFRLGVTDNSLAANPNNGGFPVDLALNTPYQVVEELDPVTLQAASIWINPISSGDPSYVASDSLGKALTSPVNAFAFRQASSSGNYFFQITNLVLATTFDEAATNVWSTNAVPPVI